MPTSNCWLKLPNRATLDGWGPARKLNACDFFKWFELVHNVDPSLEPLAAWNWPVRGQSQATSCLAAYQIELGLVGSSPGAALHLQDNNGHLALATAAALGVFIFTDIVYYFPKPRPVPATASASAPAPATSLAAAWGPARFRLCSAVPSHCCAAAPIIIFVDIRLVIYFGWALPANRRCCGAVKGQLAARRSWSKLLPVAAAARELEIRVAAK